MYTRITSKMMMTSYKSTLSSTMGQVDRDSQSVTNERRYQKDSEDPTGATRAYQYRREMTRANTYLDNAKSIKSLLDTRESVLQQISSMARTVSKEDMLGAVNGTNSITSRQAYAQQISELQLSAIQSMNTSYGGTFLFSGTSSENVPFTLSDDGTVNYRGVPVDGLAKDDLAKYLEFKKNGASTVVGDPNYNADYAALDETYNENIARLEHYVGETQYADIGFGLNYKDDGTVKSSSAFNTINNAISFLGFGIDENGNSRNLIQLMGDMAAAITEDSIDEKYVMQLTDNFENATTNVTIQLTQLGADINFMDTNVSRLDDVILNLTEKINNTEFMSEAEAITNFEESQYAYKAALQIGTQILSGSFLDYMK